MTHDRNAPDPSAYPRDFVVFVRYYYDLLNKIKARYPIPPPLMLNQLDDFLGRTQAAIRSSGREFRLLRRRIAADAIGV